MSDLKPKLEPADIDAAGEIGLQFGEDYPDIWAPMRTIYLEAGDATNDALNAIGSDYGTRKYGPHDVWTAEQLEHLVPYLNELTVVARFELCVAIAARQQMYVDSTEEPAGTRFALLRDKAFRNAQTALPDSAEDVRGQLEDEAWIAAVARGEFVESDYVRATRQREVNRLQSRIERGWEARKELIPARTATIPAPVALPYGVSPAGAEALCAQWMQHLGASDATVTRYNSDGGLDIISSAAAAGAQVKNYTGSVSVTEVRELSGVCSVEKIRPLFFTSGRYTSDAVSFANRAGVALFLYSAERGELTGANPPAVQIQRYGL